MRHTNQKLICLLLFLSTSLPYLATAANPDGYYAKADGKKKEALKAAMHDVIAPHKKISYGNLWISYEEVDYLSKTNAQGQHQVMDYYSDEIHYFTGTGSAVSGMNKEHVAPQSWWGGGTGIAVGSDLFQVIPSESNANSAKGNYPLGKVTGAVSYPSKGTSNSRMKTGKDANGDMVFEPCDEYKGDFARIFFYVATCYPDVNWQDRGDVNVSFRREDYPTLKADILPMLLQWSKNDPVCEWEITRNERVFKEQGNRNPFVDFPNLAEYIWGDSVDYAFSVDGTSSGSGGGGGEQIPEFATLVNCTMMSGLAPFFARTYEGCEGEVWTSDAKYGAKATANSLPRKEADEYLMVNIDLTHAETATLTFEHATGYNKTEPVKDTYFQVLVSKDYDGVPEDATWKMLDANFPPLPSGTSSYTSFVSSGEISLNGYSGDNITLAFRFRSNSSAAYCWEVKNVKVTAYTVPDGLPFMAETNTEKRNCQTYDLTGQLVPWNTKGIVIRNGKKILQR